MQLHHWMRTCLLNLCLLHITSYIKNIKHTNVGLEIQKPLYNLLLPQKGNNKNNNQVTEMEVLRMVGLDAYMCLRYIHICFKYCCCCCCCCCYL